MNQRFDLNEKKWRLYAKHASKSRFQPVDWKHGQCVGNLIYATVFTDNEKTLVQKELDQNLNPDFIFEWRPINGQ